MSSKKAIKIIEIKKDDKTSIILLLALELIK